MARADRIRCRFCGGTDGAVVLDLGSQPPCETFLPAGSGARAEPFALRMWMCQDCRLAQLAEDPGGPEASPSPAESTAMRHQMLAALDHLEDQGVLRTGSTVVEFGSPHGWSWVPGFLERGARALDAPGRADADIVVDVFGLLHDEDQAASLDARAASLAPGGALVVQMHSLATVLAHQEIGELRHGHFAYWSAPALAAALTSVGLGVHRARLFPHDDGTVVLIATRDPDPDQETLDLLAAEERTGATDTAGLATLQRGADRRASRLSGWLDEEIRAERRVALYGATSRSVPLLVHAGVNHDRVVAVADAAPAKQGCLLPGTDIPIVAPAALESLRPDRVVIMLTAIFDEVRAVLPFVERNGGRWVRLGDEHPRLVPPIEAATPIIG